MLFDGLRLRHWQHELDADGILILTLDREGSPVNTLGRPVLDELDEILARLAIEPPKGVIFRSGKRSGFIAGADIKEFTAYRDPQVAHEALRRGQTLFDRIAALPSVTVAAIDGFCMGGGTELSLACNYRVASNSEGTRIGLPEIKLGIFPGWGGSARMPRLIGAPQGLELMLSGRALRANQARAMGVVDAVADPETLVEKAKSLIKGRPKRPLKQRLTAWATHLWPVRQILAPMISKQVARKAPKAHYPAPYALIDNYRRFGGSEAGMILAEARAVTKLAGSDTARNLVRVFFLQERLKSAGSGEHGISRIHVVGAGVMGGDIAAWCALRGFEVSLQDRELKYIEPALVRARELFEKKLRTPEKVQAALARLKADVEGAGVPDADLVIEAIFENLEAKQSLYRSIEPRLKEGALIASNTSSIPMEALAEALDRPDRFFGLHFFNPVAMMPLVEIVRHDKVDPATLSRAAALVKKLDKLPVTVGSKPGFLVNRILVPYMLEAMNLYAEGVPGPVIDRAAKKFGMPMGPIELADQVGLDVAASVGKILSEYLGLELPKGLEGMLESGKRGRKDGQGFYTWKDGKAENPPVESSYQPPEDLEDRLILAMVNEAAATLAEGVIDDPDLLDAGIIFGTGFAPFRGGPANYAREAGIDALRARLKALEAKHGKRFAEKPGWDLFEQKQAELPKAA